MRIKLVQQYVSDGFILIVILPNVMIKVSMSDRSNSFTMTCWGMIKEYSIDFNHGAIV